MALGLLDVKEKKKKLRTKGRTTIFGDAVVTHVKKKKCLLPDIREFLYL